MICQTSLSVKNSHRKQELQKNKGFSFFNDSDSCGLNFPVYLVSHCLYGEEERKDILDLKGSWGREK